MADFDPPFGQDGDRRLPTSTERQQGFPCGPADKLLFNGLFNRVESEIGEVISFAGITPSDDRFTQLREAIEALISAATGGGDTSQFLLVTQARARLPIFPEVLNVDGRIGVTTPATGTVRLPGGVTFQHRGIFPITTEQMDFPTDPSKTYHLRWNPTDGFALKDLSSGTYNPGTLAETNAAFDSSYDDMLVARVVTNSSNVATITNLANKDQLAVSVSVQGTNRTGTPGTEFLAFDVAHVMNWARRPTTSDVYLVTSVDQNAVRDHDFNIAPEGTARNNTTLPFVDPGPTVDRYHVGAVILNDAGATTWVRISVRA